MKQLLATSILVVVCAGWALAKEPAGSTNAADQLKQIENNWTDAQKTRDADKLRDILAENWIGIGPDGKTSDRAKALEDLKSPGNSLDTLEMGPMEVRLFGNTAVVTGSDTEKSMENGKDSSGKYIWTDVFVKQKGKWKAVASQSAKVPD